MPHESDAHPQKHPGTAPSKIALHPKQVATLAASASPQAFSLDDSEQPTGAVTLNAPRKSPTLHPTDAARAILDPAASAATAKQRDAVKAAAPKDTVCRECGYSLRGLVKPVCPECGHKVSLGRKALLPDQEKLAREMVVKPLVATGVGLAITLALSLTSNAGMGWLPEIICFPVSTVVAWIGIMFVERMYGSQDAFWYISLLRGMAMAASMRCVSLIFQWIAMGIGLRRLGVLSWGLSFLIGAMVASFVFMDEDLGECASKGFVGALASWLGPLIALVIAGVLLGIF